MYLNLLKAIFGMKYRNLLLLVFIAASLLDISAQQSPTIMTINGDEITRTEFEAIYKKNNRDADVTPEALDEYAELFTNFKLKVKEAEAMKMDTSSAFLKELAGYRQQLARPYLVDNELTESLVREAYDRLKTEVKASHILIRVDPGASPADTLAGWAKIEGLQKAINAGEISFEEAAMSSSEDPSAKTNEGMLGYFTSLQMVYPFESEAYSTKTGEVSDIVRTRFGYHIIKVHDKREARGEIRAAHIMIKSKDTDEEADKIAAKAKIDELHQELDKGTKFASLTAKFSEDKSTAKNGGELPVFSTGKMVPEFEDAAFALENDGDYSEPFLTPYGWHIVKRLEKISLPSYDEKKKELQGRITKDSRAQLSQRSFVNKVKKEYGFKEDRKALDKVYGLADSTLFVGNWRPGDVSKMKKTLFTLGKKNHKQSDFIDFMRVNQSKTKEGDVRTYVDDKYELYVERSVILYEDSRLEEKYPEFKALMQEYRDGMLLFDLTDKKVWSRAIEDTTGLKAYYDAHKEDFKYEQRVKGPVYACKDQSTADRVRGMIEKGMGNDEINAAINVDTQLDLTIISGEHEKDDEEITKLIDFDEGLSKSHEIDGQVVFMNVLEVMPPEVKPFEKIKGLVTAAYQSELEATWIAELRSKYEVVIDKKVLHSIR